VNLLIQVICSLVDGMTLKSGRAVDAFCLGCLNDDCNDENKDQVE
jgi:hypothetical protein